MIPAIAPTGPAGTVSPDSADPDGDADRFARQRIIPGWDQGRLATATVVVAGVGALGNEVAKNLALAGTGRLVLCDPDVVSVSNLSRTVLFSDSDVGTPKAAAAAAALRRLAPSVMAEPRVADLVSGIGLGELADADLVIGCVDTRRARVQLLGRCALAGAALLDGGTSPSGAELRLRVSADEPCFGCTLSVHQRSVSDLPWSCAEPMGGELPEAAAVATTAVAAGWLCAAAFGVIFGAVPSWRVLSIDIGDGRAGPVAVTRDPSCPLHRPLPGPVIASAASRESTVAEFLAALGTGDEAYAWNSFALPVVCHRCGFVPSLDSELAPSDVLPCPRCGAMLRQPRSTRLRDADPGTSLAALGVAPEEMLPVMTEGGEVLCHRIRPATRQAAGSRATSS
jgi:molybdopterin/thiamine biosynthesis adenylyltransferase